MRSNLCTITTSLLRSYLPRWRWRGLTPSESQAGGVGRALHGWGHPQESNRDGNLEGSQVQVGPDPPYNGDKQFPSFSVFPLANVATCLSGGCPKVAGMWHSSLTAAQGYWQHGAYVVLRAWPCGLFSIAKMEVVPCEERQSGCSCGCKLCWDSGDSGCLPGSLFLRIPLSHPYTASRKSTGRWLSTHMDGARSCMVAAKGMKVYPAWHSLLHSRA